MRMRGGHSERYVITPPMRSKIRDATFCALCALSSGGGCGGGREMCVPPLFLPTPPPSNKEGGYCLLHAVALKSLASAFRRVLNGRDATFE